MEPLRERDTDLLSWNLFSPHQGQLNWARAKLFNKILSLNPPSIKIFCLTHAETVTHSIVVWLKDGIRATDSLFNLGPPWTEAPLCKWLLRTLTSTPRYRYIISHSSRTRSISTGHFVNKQMFISDKWERCPPPSTSSSAPLWRGSSQPIGGQAAGAARCGEPGWPAGEPHGYRGYSLGPGQRQPAQLHRFAGGRSKGTVLVI